MKVLFVSDDDLIRGPMARILACKHADDMGVYEATFESAGVSASAGSPPPPEIAAFLRSHQLNIAVHRSRPLTKEEGKRADLILCMTHEIASKARKAVGRRGEGKVLVFNDAVGFGNSAAQMDIERPTGERAGELMALFSRLKASTGRLVRNIYDGDTEASDFGAVGSDTKSDSYLDDPHLRHFLGRYIVEFVERAFEPPTTKQIREALQVMGRPLSEADIEELIESDLKRKVKLNDLGRWDIDERLAEDEAREKRERAEKARQREQEERNAGPKSAGAGSRSSAAPGGKLTVEEALAILTINKDTPREEAQKTYRKLLMRYHPDKFHDDEEFRTMAEEKAKAINRAWELLEPQLPS